MRLSSFQQHVVEMTNQFETDTEVRHMLLAYGLREKPEPLTTEETTGYGAIFKEFGTSSEKREIPRVYLNHVELGIAILRGEDAESLSPIESIIAHIHCSLWLESSAFRTHVLELRDGLCEILDLHNIALVCMLVRRGLQQTEHGWKMPPFGEGVCRANIERETALLETHIYARVQELYDTRYKQAVLSLINLGSVNIELREFFVLSIAQIKWLIECDQAGMPVDYEMLREIDGLLSSEQDEDAEAWTETKSGLLLPRNMEET